MISDKKVLVIDNGSFVHLAERLARDFDQVLYTSPWIKAFPESLFAAVGKGLPNVQRVDQLFDWISKVDLVVFPDLYYADLQVYLREQGVRVFGLGRAEDLEVSRFQTRKWMKSVGLPVPDTRRVKGLVALRELLQNEKDLYVKVSRWRGDTESFHHEEYFMSESILEEMEHKLGVRKSDVEFIVEKPLEDMVEYGTDTYTVDGKFPSRGLWGYEVKDHAYVGAFCATEKMPKSSKTVNDELAKVFEMTGARGFFSTEIRQGKDGRPFLIDPTMRCPSPPSELYADGYKNISQVIWDAAGGELTDPEFIAPYGAEAIIYCKFADNDWIALEVEDAKRERIKLKQHMMKDGHDYVVPLQQGLVEIGAVIGFGKTIEAAIEDCKKNAEGIKGLGIEVRTDSFEEANSVIKRGEEYGITF